MFYWLGSFYVALWLYLAIVYLLIYFFVPPLGVVFRGYGQQSLSLH
jgi:hypothetical protein